MQPRGETYAVCITGQTYLAFQHENKNTLKSFINNFTIEMRTELIAEIKKGIDKGRFKRS
jgi:hypothetical protein